MDQSFEGESFSITFHANAACVKELTAGQHTIKVETIRNGAGATTIENTEMQWVVVS